MATRDDSAGRADERQSERRSYRTPELTVHGDVAEITGNVGTGVTDGIVGCSGSQ